MNAATETTRTLAKNLKIGDVFTDEYGYTHKVEALDVNRYRVEAKLSMPGEAAYMATSYYDFKPREIINVAA